MFKLHVWLSPSSPVGSFAFSHGIEWAAQKGHVRDAATAAEWIGTLLQYGSLKNDVILASLAWRAAAARDDSGLQDGNDLALALAGCSERFMETASQGNAFVAGIRSAWMTSETERALACFKRGYDIAYPVAVGVSCAGHGIARGQMLNAFALALVQALVSAIIRLSVLGQTDGQRVIAQLFDVAAKAAEAAHDAGPDDLGSAAFQSDIAAIKHETQYTRLFRS